MEITLDIPESMARTLGYARESLPRRALEALLVDECARGRISCGKVAELLGLSFYEAEDLFRSHRGPYPIKSSVDDDGRNQLSLPGEDRVTRGGSWYDRPHG